MPGCPSKCPACEEPCRGIEGHEPPFHGDSTHVWLMMQSLDMRQQVPDAATLNQVTLSHLGLRSYGARLPGVYIYPGIPDETFDNGLEAAAGHIERNYPQLQYLATELRAMKISLRPIVGVQRELPVFGNHYHFKEGDERIEAMSDEELGIISSEENNHVAREIRLQSTDSGLRWVDSEGRTSLPTPGPRSPSPRPTGGMGEKK